VTAQPDGQSISFGDLEAPYAPRAVRFIRTEYLRGWRLKMYGIGLDGQDAREELVAATRELAFRLLPEPAAGDSRYGVGFATAHDAATFCIALVYWWQAQNELHQRIFVSPKHDPAALAQVENQPAGCVWELEVVDFERRAWLTDVLANPRGPDLERYLSRTFDTEL
jgi:hypothetical protein